MKRYLVPYKDWYLDELAMLPMDGKSLFETIYINVERSSNLKDSDVAVDLNMDWIDIALTNEEFKNLKIEAFEKGDYQGRPFPKQYSISLPFGDPDGFAFGQYYCNEYSEVFDVLKPYPLTPNRRDIFSGAVFTWNTNFSRGTISDGQLVSPTKLLLGIDSFWDKDIDGSDLKIGIIDVGVMKGHNYADCIVEDSFNASGVDGEEYIDSDHSIGIVSQLVGNTNLKGSCFNAKVYAANYNNYSVSFDWLVSKGVKFINMSFLAYPDTFMIAKMEKFIRDGGIICVAAGNNLSQSEINPMCLANGVVVVGGTNGGGINKFNGLRYNQTTPVRNKSVDFVAPFQSINQVTDASPGPSGPKYTYQGGTSNSCPEVLGAIALVSKRFSSLDSRSVVNLVKMTADIHDSGFKIPNLRNII